MVDKVGVWEWRSLLWSYVNMWDEGIKIGIAYVFDRAESPFIRKYKGRRGEASQGERARHVLR